MFKFRSFGSGSSGNCYWFETDEGAFLIDAGVSYRNIIKHFVAYSAPAYRLKGIFLTHDHADHAKAAIQLANRYRIPIYTTSGVFQGVSRLLVAQQLLAENQRVVIEKGAPLTLCGCTITPFDVPHDSTDCVGYLLQYDGITSCLITDAGHLTEEMKGYVELAHHLIIEADYDEEMLWMGRYPKYLKRRISSETGHLSNQNTAQILTDSTGTQLMSAYLCHLSGANNRPDIARYIIEQHWEAHEQRNRRLNLHVLARAIPSDLFIFDLPEDENAKK